MCKAAEAGTSNEKRYKDCLLLHLRKKATSQGLRGYCNLHRSEAHTPNEFLRKDCSHDPGKSRTRRKTARTTAKIPALEEKILFMGKNIRTSRV